MAKGRKSSSNGESQKDVILPDGVDIRQQLDAALAQMNLVGHALRDEFQRIILLAAAKETRPMTSMDLQREASQRIQRNSNGAFRLRDQGFLLAGQSKKNPKSNVYLLTAEWRSKVLPMIFAVATLLQDEDDPPKKDAVPVIGGGQIRMIDELTDDKSRELSTEFWLSDQPQTEEKLKELLRLPQCNNLKNTILYKMRGGLLQQMEDTDAYGLTGKTRAAIGLALQASLLPPSTIEIGEEEDPITGPITRKPSVGTRKKGGQRKADLVSPKPATPKATSREPSLFDRTDYLDTLATPPPSAAKPSPGPQEKKPPLIVLRNGQLVDLRKVPTSSVKKPTSSSSPDPE